MTDAYDSLILSLGANTHFSGLNVASGTTLTDLGPGAHNFTAQGAASVNGETGPHALGKPTIPKVGSTSADYFLGTPQLLGVGSWVISFWAYQDLPTPPSGTNNYCVYQEAGSAGSAVNQIKWTGTGNSQAMTLGFHFHDNASASFTVSTQTVYQVRQFCHLVIVRNGASVSIYLNGARQITTSGLSTSTSQSPTSPDARIGVDRAASLLPFPGAVWRFSIWNSLSTAFNTTASADATVRQIYETGMPMLPTTDLDTPCERSPGTFFAANAWVNQRLPKGNPGDTGYPVDPAYPMGSSALNTLINAPATPTTAPNHGVATQMLIGNYPGISASSSTIRIYVILPSTPTSSYTVQPVAMAGGRYANSRVDKEDLWQSFRAVPIPNDAVASGVAYDPSPGGAGIAANGVVYQLLDEHVAIIRVNSDGTIEHWEMIKFRKTLPLASIANATAVVGASGSAVGTNLPSGTYDYEITMFNGNGDSDSHDLGSNVVTDGTKAITVSNTQLGDDPARVAPTLAQPGDGLQGFHVWRKQVSGDGLWYLLDTLTWVPGTTATAGAIQVCGGSGGSRNVYAPVDYISSGIQYIDDGSQVLGAVNSGGSSIANGAYTSGVWSASLGGYYPDLRQCSGAFDQPGKTDWGGTATSIMKTPGTIGQREIAAGVIDHAIGAAFPYPALGTNAFVYPATRNDGIQNNGVLKEGTRLALPRAIDLSVYAPGLRSVMKALQEFGMIVMDKSAGVTFYIEDTSTKGRDLLHTGLGMSFDTNPKGIDPSTMATVAGGLAQTFTFSATFTGSSSTAAVTGMPSWVNLGLAQTNAIPVSGTGITAGTTITSYSQGASTVTFSTTPTAGTVTVTVVGFPWVLLVPINPAWTQAQATTTPVKQVIKGRT